MFQFYSGLQIITDIFGRYFRFLIILFCFLLQFKIIQLWTNSLLSLGGSNAIFVCFENICSTFLLRRGWHQNKDYCLQVIFQKIQNYAIPQFTGGVSIREFIQFIHFRRLLSCFVGFSVRQLNQAAIRTSTKIVNVSVVSNHS